MTSRPCYPTDSSSTSSYAACQPAFAFDALRPSRAPAAIVILVRFMLACATLAATLSCARAGEAFPDAGIAYADAVIQVLVEQHVCADPQDCRRKELVFWEGGNPLMRSRKMVYVLIYEANDRAVYESVVARLARLKEATAMPSVEVIAYKSRRRQPKMKFAETMLK